MWKLILGISAVIIVGISLFYTQTLVKKIADEERQQVKLWADAIRKKATLVKYTSDLFKKIADEERKKVELWAEATKELANANSRTDYTFVLKVVADNTTVPVILVNDTGEVVSHRNLSAEISKNPELVRNEMQKMAGERPPIEVVLYGKKRNYLYYKDSRLFSELRKNLDDIIESFISEIVVNSASVPVIYTDASGAEVISSGNVNNEQLQDKEALKELLSKMKADNPPIEIDLGDGSTHYIFYTDSQMLTLLKYFPVFQFSVIGLFILIAYWLFSIARKAEQNQVWVGMAKETAHQLGTPLSSMMAWMELLKEQGIPEETVKEMNKDISRLETITERFSKIGSEPNLERQNVVNVLENSINYFKVRTSDKIKFEINCPLDHPVDALMNVPLFEWVIENLFKNAIDAIGRKGIISVTVKDQNQYVYLDVSDTGKGIPSGKLKTVFQPGFTTKKRGWGLGLSLSKRIIENYHNGKIFVLKSEADEGTTFRIVLNKRT